MLLDTGCTVQCAQKAVLHFSIELICVTTDTMVSMRQHSVQAVLSVHMCT